MDAQAILKTNWDDSPEFEFGQLIIDFLAANTDSVHITFSQFFELAKVNPIFDQDVVLNVVNYLSGNRLPLLKARFEYIDDETVELLDIDQVRAAKDGNINPITGVQDGDVGNKIFMFFCPSDVAKRVLVTE